LEVLKRMQRDSPDAVVIVDADLTSASDVDEKLVLLAKQWGCPVMTNDFNLNKVATLQGVKVLNINELANAVKSVLLPGESLAVKIIQEGKEAGQGVGYLDDGTMVVVEDGRNWINENVNVVVTKVLQTAAGRMIFARPASDRSAINS
ncbi:MAG: PIN/TRAM domain-containing protein, partial [Candidatus Roseilinea sp.]|uniref:PIN/TRAM domain-containing protein n=1 Tax=Candidatus Roseilinea sp. TaxID=2838777 RepID=UPI00404A1E64